MDDTMTFSLKLPCPADPCHERTSSGRDLDDALDAWLLDEFMTNNHVHSWIDASDQEVAR